MYEDNLEVMNKRLKHRLARVIFLAEHLMQMIPREVWRETGGDDGQGHYEGDYREAQLYQELQELKKLTGESDGSSRRN